MSMPDTSEGGGTYIPPINPPLPPVDPPDDEPPTEDPVDPPSTATTGMFQVFIVIVGVISVYMAALWSHSKYRNRTNRL